MATTESADGCGHMPQAAAHEPWGPGEVQSPWGPRQVSSHAAHEEEGLEWVADEEQPDRTECHALG